MSKYSISARNVPYWPHRYAPTPLQEKTHINKTKRKNPIRHVAMLFSPTYNSTNQNYTTCFPLSSYQSHEIVMNSPSALSQTDEDVGLETSWSNYRWWHLWDSYYDSLCCKMDRKVRKAATARKHDANLLDSNPMDNWNLSLFLLLKVFPQKKYINFSH